ncbi:MAG: HD domain-containing protein [Candidatus Aenigmatarchaeota archaeon]
MNIQKFLDICLSLKGIKRAGWTERGVKNPESSAEHTFLVAVLTLVFSKGRKIDLEKALKMALVHDLPEAITGDIISKNSWEEGGTMWDKEKHEKERTAMQKISNLSGNKEILRIWEEFVGQETPESRFVKDIDKVATIIQAIDYHKKGNHKKPLEGFWDKRAISKIRDPELVRLVNILAKSAL